MTADIPLIRLSLNIPITDANMPVALEFMQQFNVILSGQSTLNYHLIPITNRPFIYIPVFPYNRGEFTDDINKLIKDRIKQLKSFVSKYDFNNERKQIKWNLRSMLIIRNQLNEPDRPLFKIENRELELKETVDIWSGVKLEYPKMKRYMLADKSCISVLHDPYASNDHLILANLSKPFSEMRYQYNALHLYEHLMTYAWKDGNHNEEAYMNGITVVNGISNIFAVLMNPEALMNYLNKYIDFILGGRDRKFWLDRKEMVRVETLRTISETRAARSFSSPSRSDPAAYDYNYNIDIFCKWSNEPFDVLLITDANLKIDVNRINAKILSAKRTNVQLPTPTGSFVPVESLMDKSVVRIVKESPENVLKEIWANGFGNVEGKLYGIDNYMVFPTTFSIDFDYRLHGLLYFHRIVKNIEKYDEKFMHSVVLPHDYKKML